MTLAVVTASENPALSLDSTETDVSTLEIEKLASLLRAYGEVHIAIRRLRTWATLRLAEETTDAARRLAAQQARDTSVTAERRLRPVDDLLARSADAAYTEVLRHPALAFCRQFLEVRRRQSAHRLTEEAEAVAAAVVANDRMNWIRLHEATVNSISVPVGGHSVPLDQALGAVRSADRALRAAASEAIGRRLSAVATPATACYEAIVAQRIALDSLRDRRTGLSPAAGPDAVGGDLTSAVVEAVSDNYATAQRWWLLKASILGIEDPKHYDRMAPVELTDDRWSLIDASDLIVDSYTSIAAPLGEIAQRAFSQGWIDALPRPGKQGGAFCAPAAPDTHPYICMAFDGTIDSVLTLAHEVGHAVHFELARGHGIFHASPQTVCRRSPRPSGNR